jgi:hypothetical protein
MTAISNALNAGRLPPGYYALAEQIAGDMVPDVLTLEIEAPNGRDASINQSENDKSLGGAAVSVVEPKARFKAETEMDWYVLKQNTLVVHHSGGDEVIALIEIVSPGNKASVDLQPPGPRDPNGIHGAIWEEIADASFRLPADKPLTLVSYSAGSKKRAYIEPVAVGDMLPDRPLFLRPGVHIPVPLEETYQTAWQNVPQRWRQVLEPPPTGSPLSNS